MIDYQKRADLLKTWTVDEVKANPELAVGSMRSAASVIESLGRELESLHRENFWLTKNHDD